MTVIRHHQLRKCNLLPSLVLIAKRTTLLLTLLFASGSMLAAEKDQDQRPFSPYVSQNFPQNVYFGDTHLHTRNSIDAIAEGQDKLGPDEAFRFARGETVRSSYTDLPVKLQRPLDFLVVADHSEYLGMMAKIIKGDPGLMENDTAKRWHDLIASGESGKAFYEVFMSVATNNEAIRAPKIKRDIWEESIASADNNNQPGIFTAFIGFEWSSLPNFGNNLHRVVIYKDGADKAKQKIPFSAFDSEDPEALWEWLADYEQLTGGSVLALAHNGNVSNGMMFANTTFSGKPMTVSYAKMRPRWEPLYEVTQMKGDGEAHPRLSPNDQFADFETWDKGNLAANAMKKDSMLQFEYARSALKNGLSIEAKLGVNPFKFGLIGSTDSHTGLSTADSDNYFGKMSKFEPSAQRMKQYMANRKAFTWTIEQTAASGYAAIWATRNTREALFDAMQRRETYATTGPRMTVRFFGGWDFETADAYRPNYAQIGYKKGVPMGGDLTTAPTGKSPRFLIIATKDSTGANLDRVQVIKGWLDQLGHQHEKVYNVIASDGRQIENNQLIAVGSSVDINDASYSNTIGAASLAIVWTDPDFKPQQRAFYYLRVLEIPTPRWTVYDAKRFGVDLPTNTPLEIQERAYTSPIWYTP